MKDDEETRKLVEKAQLEEAAVGGTGNPKNKFPDLNVLRKFSERYSNFKIENASDIEPTGPWKLLYRAKGKMEGFHGELNFNTENGSLLLVIKGPSFIKSWEMAFRCQGHGFWCKRHKYGLCVHSRKKRARANAQIQGQTNAAHHRPPPRRIIGSNIHLHIDFLLPATQKCFIELK
jgi:hypothetical protein